MSIRHITGILLAIAGSMHLAYGQERVLLRKGNELYGQQKFNEAAALYQQALTKNPASVTGMFNLGNAYYKQKQLDAARRVMAATAKQSADSLQRSGAQYNIGNTYMDEKKWQDAIEAYKQALRNNPQDEAAKYNLSYAREMLKQQQQSGGGKNDKNQDKDKNKDNKQQQQQQKDQQNKEQQDNRQQQQDNKQQQEQQRPEPGPSKLSEQQADQILNALQQEEKHLQDKQQQAKGVPVKLDKDW